jgi:nicotinamide-nucleotide amidase
MADAEKIAALAEALIEDLVAAGKTVAAAESCTGGWIAKSLTDISGSSAVFGYGVVSYSNAAKCSLLGVSAEALREHGAVSEVVAAQMAEGVLRLSGADLAVAVSGIAGPGGGTDEKPVGTVWFAWTAKSDGHVTSDTERHVFGGDRDSVRRQTVVLALQGLRERIRKRG